MYFFSSVWHFVWCSCFSVCGGNEHTCHEHCIPTTAVCNRYIDCFNGSDEQSCGKIATLIISELQLPNTTVTCLQFPGTKW